MLLLIVLSFFVLDSDTTPFSFFHSILYPYFVPLERDITAYVFAISASSFYFILFLQRLPIYY